MDNSFSTLIDESKSILVLLPEKPSFDQVAGGLALYLSLRDKKPVTISSPTSIMVGMNRLVGVNKITQEIGNKNLTLTFPDYDAGNIEKVSYDIENGEFKLTVIPKSGSVAPQKEQISINYSGISSDLVVLVGGAIESEFPTLNEEGLTDAKIAHIGTRVFTSEKGVMSFAKPASSISELIASLIKETALPIDTDVATNLVMGVEEGSNHFEGGDVTPETFEIFAYLLKSGGQRLPKQKLRSEDFPPGSIPGNPVFTQKPETKAAKSAADTSEEGQDETPPDEWLQPKVYKGTSIS
ncbi:MAG: bifunctional oligoribonuclease/PAP phosphatase NrnA [Microgenomates group bacterium]